jgi:queuosine precursor transporter
MSRAPDRQFKYYDFVMAAYVCIAVCANVIGPSKLTTVPLGLHLPFFGDHITFLAGVLFFPISYIFGDVLTEVYGYARDRRVVWAGFGALAFTAFMAYVVVALPPAAGWHDQAAVATIFGSTPRIIVASISAFWCGSFVNSFVMAKMKLWSNGRWLWTRTIGSTLCGEAVDTSVFMTLAFLGVWSAHDLLARVLIQYAMKSGWEIIMTPITYKVVGFLKRAEQEDFYDRDTNFTPFSLKT